MIDAGEKAYEKTYTLTVHRRHEMVSAIYEAMTDQKQKDALIAYHDAVKDNEVIINSIGHSSR